MSTLPWDDVPGPEEVLGPIDLEKFHVPDKPTEAPVMAAQQTLTADDRCDSCRAQAYVVTQQVYTNPMGERVITHLLFCGHCATKYAAHVDPLVVHDERHKLNARLTSSY